MHTFVRGTFFLMLGLVTWFLLIKLAWDETIAFWSSLLVASSPLIVSQSRIVMSEIPVLSLTIVTMYWYFRFSESLRTRDLVFAVVSFFLACYAKQLAIFALPVLVVHFTWSHGVRALFSKRLILAGAAVGVLLVPLVVMTVRFSPTNVAFATSADYAFGLGVPIREASYYVRQLWEGAFVAPVAALGVLGVVGAVLLKQRQASLFLVLHRFEYKD